MILVYMLLSLVPVQISPLGLIEQPPVQCSQEGLSCSFRISKSRCLDGLVRPRDSTPGMPDVKAEVSYKADKNEEIVPVLILKLSEPSDTSICSLQAMEVQVLEVATNSSLCALFTFLNKVPCLINQDGKPWTFTLDQIMVDPGLKYQISASNLPKPDLGSREIILNITVPGCAYHKMRNLRVCLENGTLWKPNLTWSLTGHEGNGGVMITFNTGQFSELYRVSIYHPDFHISLSLNVSEDNQTWVSVLFPLEAWQLKHCDFVFAIKPFFVRCMNSCSEYQQKVQIPLCPAIRLHMIWTVLGLSVLILCAFTVVCLHTNLNKESVYSHNTSDKEEVEGISEQKPSKVLILYSLDHPLYKEIILKLCAFLRAKCGTDVTLDLLDFTWISTLGGLQWLDMQREKLSRSSDKVLILCSPGVYAKWRGMCGGNRVMTREDIRSPIGDMLTPALSLMVPDFVYASSFQKYIVAYFDDVCSEKDVPAPFKVAVKYRLMKNFEELFFRLVDKEKHEPGRIKQVEGIGGDDYFNSSYGRALREAIKAFQAYQLANPHWFEKELVDADGEVEESGHKQEGGAELSCDCVIQNQLWSSVTAATVFINKVTGQIHKDQSSNTHNKDPSDNYPTGQMDLTLRNHISNT